MNKQANKIGVGATNYYDMQWDEVRDRVAKLGVPPGATVFGVPRGGAIVAGLTGLRVVSAAEADFIVDDIVDSGRTLKEWAARFPGKPFLALVDKTGPDKHLPWVRFPWEQEPEQDAESSVVRLLQHIGEDPNREGLVDTPRRVVKAWDEMTCGYGQDPAVILARDFDGQHYDEMIAVPRLAFYSTCEHHMLPFFGFAHVAYLPKRGKGSRVVGLSKLGRLVDCFARRLQIQEQMTTQIADAIEEHLDTLGVGVVVQARHLCMCARGVQKHTSTMVTSAMRGAFRQGPARAEFLSLVQMNGGGL